MKVGLRLSPSAWIGLVMLALFVVFGVLGPLLAPFDPGMPDLSQRFFGASSTHWFGTDSKGVDTLSQLLWGAREALVISVTVVAISSALGIALGTIAGWFRGAVDEMLMRLVDILMAFPGILLNITVVATVARPGLGTMIAALCVNGWVSYARVARGQVLALRERDYIAAAVAVGATNRRVMMRHLIPNLMNTAIVQMTFGLGSVILIEASLSFLGLGPQIDYTWGAMLEQGTTFLWRPGFLYYALLPGLAITWVVISANLLGDGLRDRFDPRLRGRG
ncbi:MAG: binding-protein-dependent transport system inner rane component [Myxococcales bacterium]|nr:binding-protein-dependent transport system inner rane component [Myxococcales bacterium]